MGYGTLTLETKITFSLVLQFINRTYLFQVMRLRLGTFSTGRTQRLIINSIARSTHAAPLGGIHKSKE